MREIRTSGSTRGQWVAAQPSLTVLLYRSNFTFVEIDTSGAGDYDTIEQALSAISNEILDDRPTCAAGRDPSRQPGPPV